MTRPSWPKVGRLQSQRLTLDNGLRVRLVSLPHLQSATVSVLVRGGSRYETAETNGLSHFLEHMLYRGTTHHPRPQDLNFAIESLGGTLDAATHVDFMRYDLTVPPENLSSAIALVAEVIQVPLLEDVSTEKKIISEEILRDLNEEGEEIEVDGISRRLLFPRHPLGFPIAGPLHNVQRFTPKDVQQHHRAHYVAKNSALCIAGPFDEPALVDAVQASFGSWKPGTELDLGEAPSGSTRERFSYVGDSGSQTDVRVSFRTGGLHSGQAPALWMLSRVFDDGLSTRLHRTICEEQGLAYDVFAGVDLLEDCGVFDFGASVEHQKTKRLVETVLGVVEQVQKAAPTTAELDKAKQRYLWDLRTVRDDTESVSHFVGMGALFGLPEDLEAIAQQVAAVTPDEVQHLAHTQLSRASAHVTCVGVLNDKQRAAIRRLLVV